MLQEALKQATRKNHDELEKLMFVNDIMNGILSVDQYKKILITNYTLHKVLEDDLLSSLSSPLAQQLATSSRRKLPSLIKDLQQMKLDANEIQNNCKPEIPITDAAILGAMYVMEGATLGGSVIVKKLKSNPNFSTIDPAFNYYQVYSDQLIVKWKEFCAVLNEQPESVYPESIDAATKVFEYLASIQRQSLIIA